MKISAGADGADRLAGVLRQRGSGPQIDGMLKDAAEALRAEAARELDEVPGISDQEAEEALTLAPLADGSGYSLIAASDAAWNAEFGSRRRAPEPWLSRAVAAALPRINHIGRTLIRRLGAASRSHSGE